MTDNEIIKALECHIAAVNDRKNTCIDCPLYKNTSDCLHVLVKSTFDLINRQKSEIESIRKLFVESGMEQDRLMAEIERLETMHSER